MSVAIKPSLTRESIREMVNSVPYWFHSIDLEGVITPGHKSLIWLEDDQRHFPDVNGKSVLDLGAWDGAHSFWAERNGASRVVALDHFSWMVDRKVQDELKGGRILRWEDTPAWKPETLPGKAGFDLARKLLGSKVETVVADFMNDELDIGKFDVVLFLGQLYHHQDPVKSLQKVYSLLSEGGMAVIESEAIYIHGYDDHKLCVFYEDKERITNWFIPNIEAIKAMCRRAGFSQIEVKAGPPEIPNNRLRSAVGHVVRDMGIREKYEPVNYRAFVHAWA